MSKAVKIILGILAALVLISFLPGFQEGFQEGYNQGRPNQSGNGWNQAPNNNGWNQAPNNNGWNCLLYTSPSPRDQRGSRMPSSA